MGGQSKGRIIAVNGPLATCEVEQGQEVLQNEVAYVHCQGAPLKAEVIRVRGRQIDMQVFESTTGMVVGDEVNFSGELLSVTLGPGILGMIYDGLQNPLKQEWPVKMPVRTYAERLLPNRQLLTQCRLIDIFFPLAEGGTSCIPGPFGAGKTVLQQIISRYAEADVVIIVACGERAGEVVETIREFPELEDPKTGESLMNRTVIICNTSSMPVAAREASIYTGISIGEYYRQLGLKVLLLADSTSRWAQALRESSARLEEIPGEEAFPAYLESRIAAVYERAGLVRLHDGNTGSLTLIGTVSPAGGNFEEPVTQNTLKVVGAFYGLSRSRSDQRRYPAIDPQISWSLYLRQMRESLEERREGWVALVEEVHRLIFAGNEVHQMMLVVGEEGISVNDLTTYLKSEIVDAVCLQQDSFDPVDRATSRERQISDFLLLMDVVRHPFAFETKEQARRAMTALHNAFFQMKYCPFQGEKYKMYRDEIEGVLARKGADCP